MITFGLECQLAKKFDEHIYEHQLKKGKLIERLIEKYLEDNSYNNLIPLKTSLKDAELQFIEPEKFD